jgi:hypothetical protein
MVFHKTSEVFHDSLIQVFRVYTLIGLSVITRIHCDMNSDPVTEAKREALESSRKEVRAV